MPELELDHVKFDKSQVELLIKKLDSSKYAERENAEREINQMLKASGYPLCKFLMNVDAEGQGSFDKRIRLGRILKTFNSTEGDIYHLKDWEGNSLPSAYCEVFEMTGSRFVFDKEHAKFVGRTTSRADGVLCLPDLTSVADFPEPGPNRKSRPMLGIIVHASGYGTAGAIVGPHNSDVFLPIVKDGSKAALRAARGTVVDEAGKPIQGVAIKPEYIEIPGQGSYSVRGEGLVFSDHKGRFRVYGWPQRTKNKFLPVGAEHKLHFSAEGFFPMAKSLANDEPKKLVLRRGKKFHRFSFKDPKVPADLKHVDVYRESSNGTGFLRTALPDAYISKGGRLLPGTYVATFRDGRGYEARFKPIVVGEDSPELLTFEPPDPTTFQGKVFDGITGEPAAGVVVFGAYASGSEKLVSITDEQLEALQSAPIDELEQHPTAIALGKTKGIKVITKTDAEGTYSVTLAPDVKIYGFYMVAPRMLPFEIRALMPEELKKKSRGKKPKEINEVGVIQLDPMYQFPAARIHFSPRFPEGSERQRGKLWPAWKVDGSVKPPWFSRFTDAKKARNGLPGFYPSFYWIRFGGKDGRRQTVTVPAGIKLQLSFKPSQAGFGPIYVAEKLLLEPGDEYDLGDLEMLKTVPVQVLVVDANGNGLEGVSVRHRYLDGGAWNIGVATDFNGQATVLVTPGLKGEFGAIDIRGPEGRLRDKNLKAAFEIEDGTAGPFTIQLTDEQAALLPKEGEE